MEQNIKSYVVERHLKAGYPSVFESLEGAEITVKKPVGACTDIFYIVSDRSMEELRSMTGKYLAEGIGSFQYSPEPFLEFE